MTKEEKLKEIKGSLAAIMGDPQNRWVVIIGTGPSRDIDEDFGMPALAEHLTRTMIKETDGWNEILRKLKNGADLETALQGVNLNEELVAQISAVTAKFVTEVDIRWRDKLLTGQQSWAAETLLFQLIRGLPSTWPRLPVVTTNYDMLIEYACSKLSIPYITGYHGGIVRRLDWSKARERLYRYEQVAVRGRKWINRVSLPCVELMKVHGSINLFRDKSDQCLVENDMWTSVYPESKFTQMVAPPGDIKISDVLTLHEALFGEAYSAIDEKATAVLAIGYGFRDTHLDQHVLERVRKDNCPLIVLTLDPPEKLIEPDQSGEHVWIVSATKNSRTDAPELKNTRVTNPKTGLTEDFKDVALWRSDIFAREIMGG